jgi:hypothetical protein
LYEILVGRPIVIRHLLHFEGSVVHGGRDVGVRIFHHNVEDVALE